MSRLFALPSVFSRRGPRVNLIRLQGAIGPLGRARLSDAALAPILERAFRSGRPRAVALVINSPGGSAAQSALIAARIRRLAQETKVSVLAFVEDAAASGGYWIACAADEIYCDATSIVGSIGVIFTSFGAHEALARLGLERRIHTAGAHKSQLDPFLPENPEDVARLKVLLTTLHEAFIAHVKDRRGARLATDTDLFDGRFWPGVEAVRLGLVDGLGHVEPVLKARYGEKVRIVPFALRPTLAQKLGLAGGFGKRASGCFGAHAGFPPAPAEGALSLALSEAMALAEERALWTRLGL